MITDRRKATQAGAYLRLSPRPDGQYELGLERQRQDCNAKAKAIGWKIVRAYVDEDRSAYRGRRPAYEAMLVDIQSGMIDGVVAYNLDRLYRSNRELEDGISLCERLHFPLVTADGEVDLSGPDGQFQARILTAVARKSSDDESRRMKRKHVQLAEDGLPAGGTRPFGYRADRITIDKREAKLIREAVDAVFRGASIRGICKDWNAKGITSPRGNPWRQFTLKHVLTSPRLAGLRAHKGVVVGPAKWEAIVTEDEHVRLKAILNDPARRTNKGSPVRRYLLTGVAHCALCDAKLVPRPNAARARCYVCATGVGFAGCGKIRILAEETEETVREQVFAQLGRAKLARAVERRRRGTGKAADEIASVEADLEFLSHEFAEGRLTRREWETARPALVARLDSLNESLSTGTVEATALAVHLGHGDELRGNWHKMTLDEQRTIVSSVVERVTVHPAGKRRGVFDPNRVTITWRV